eukprot:CAMPEP_0197240918 /NCGR_PEP_ID=MMETSP1429-20130617/7102_1 /TAXON_ID=49237 /ORGANISM="Chaetoceros  sp., Strain UNC1202" /LENGTH=43 /DNA_ID= /DNA_START= /DNA_END= /DNA_ORIENTATION=
MRMGVAAGLRRGGTMVLRTRVLVSVRKEDGWMTMVEIQNIKKV